MPNLISIKVDVTKIDKSRLFTGKPDKNGHTPKYLDLILIPRKEVGKFGDTHLVKQSKKKDEQVDLPIIGSATERGSEPPAAKPETTWTTSMNPADEDVPF